MEGVIRMLDAEEILSKIDKKTKDLADLYAQMDSDYDLWSIKPQVFDKHPMAINITSNLPRALGDKVQAELLAHKLQIIVISPENYPSSEAQEITNAEERLYYFGFEQADLRLRGKGEAKLADALAWFAIIRGMIAARIYVYSNNQQEVIWDFLPLDPRYLTFAFDNDGLAWTGYTTFRSSENLKRQYAIEVEDKDGKGVEIIEYFDRDIQAVINKKDKTLLRKIKKHTLKQVPIVLIPIALSPRIINNEGMQVTSWGQSIFAPNRVTYKQLNLLRSIVATHAHLLAKIPLVHTYPSGSPVKLDSQDIPYYPCALIDLPDTEKLEGLKVPDIPRSLMEAIQEIVRDIQLSTYAEHEFGRDVPPHSGIALQYLSDKSKVILPRLIALNDMYTDICRMVKKQIITQGISVPIRSVKDNVYVAYEMVPSLLDNDFYIKAEFVDENPWKRLENIQLAQMMIQNKLMSKENVMEQILKIPDVKTEVEKMTIEEAENLSPEMKFTKALDVYQRTERGREYEMLKKVLTQIMQANEQQSGVPPTPPQGAEGI